MKIGRFIPGVVLGLAVCLLVTGRASVARAQAPLLRSVLRTAVERALHEASVPPAHHDDHHHHHGSPRLISPVVPLDTFSDRRLGVSLEILPTGGMQVLDVDHGSPAQRAGIEFGDVLLRIEGRELEERADYLHAMRSSDGHLDLLIRDVRSGRLVACHVHVPVIERPVPEERIDLCGRWQSEIGVARLTHTGDSLRGTIDLEGTGEELMLVGRVIGRTVTFQWYRNSRSFGTGEFTVSSCGTRLNGNLQNAARGTNREFNLTRI